MEGVSPSEMLLVAFPVSRYLADRKRKKWHFLRHSSKGRQPQSVAFTLYVEVVRLIQTNLDEPYIPT